VADYSEFPTTPTAWQEAAWQEVQPVRQEDPPVPPRRRPDLTALVPGVFFSLLAIVLMSGLDVPLGIFRDGGILWALLIAGGVALLVTERRRARARR
jgi:hypothetical protein